MKLLRACSLVLVLGLLSSVPVTSQDKPAPRKYALLVGCTRYDDARVTTLAGPANDVLLMRDFLQKQFDFPAANITILSEAQGGNLRPTRAHIEREMVKLARIANPGDQVVILLSGHGSRQPQRNPDSDENFEPDGLDNIFLPADFKLDASKQSSNAIVDDEVKTWLQAIRARGASILIMVDSCHSATMIRGNGAEVVREVPAEKLFPREILESARARAARKNPDQRGVDDRPPFALSEQTAGLVAIYAAQRSELTSEDKLPLRSRDARPHGLLTYSIVQIISESSRPITYTELVQRIQAQYIEWGRTWPTPLVEGKDQEKEFLGGGVWKGRSAIQVSQNEDGDYRINAGALHRLTAGSILAVYPPAGSANADQPIGHVCVQQLRNLDAIVKPCAFAKLPEPRTIPAANRCAVVYTDYSAAMRLTLAIDGDKASAGFDKLNQELERLSKSPASMIALARDAASADWLVRLEGDRAVLVPGSGLLRGDGEVPAFYGPVAINDQVGSWLEDRVGRILRARNLVTLAAATENLSRQVEGVDVGVEILRYANPEQRDQFEVVKAQGRGLTLAAGAVISFRVSNRNRFAVDISLLFVDSGHGILPLFPRDGTVSDNRLGGGKSLVTPRVRITAKTVGLEHLVLIAVKARSDEQPANFSFLAQPSLELATKLRGAQDPSLTSPLGQLFQSGLYGAGTLRGPSNDMLQEHAFRVISWRTR